jgi:hypothetical protein
LHIIHNNYSAHFVFISHSINAFVLCTCDRRFPFFEDNDWRRQPQFHKRWSPFPCWQK